MYIKKVQIDNFGKFHNKAFHFMPGLNVVYGENESGKSTLHSFLVGSLFGLEKQRGRGAGAGSYERYEPWNAASYYTGSLEFSVAGKDFTIERNFYHKEKRVRLYNQRDREELSVEQGDLGMLLGGVSKRFYQNTCCIAQAAVATEESFGQELNMELVNRAHGGEFGIDILKADKTLELKGRQQEQQQKSCRLKRQERLERLEWEQELVKEDIRQLEKKIDEMDDIFLGPEDTEDVPVRKNTVKAWFIEEYHRVFFWRIPVIGWIGLLLTYWFRVRPFRKKQEREERDEAFSFKILLDQQVREKKTHLFNVQEELTEARGLTSEERENETELESIRLAREVLKQVTMESYRDGRDAIAAAVSEIFSGITGGKYDRLEVTEEGGVFLYDAEKKLRPWQLSRGTMEQLYFALRLGTARCLLEEDMPVLLDETFCAYDDLRLGRTLQWMARQKEQIILFTCQKRELLLLEELGVEHHRILL